jgi:hypothetical protein
MTGYKDKVAKKFGLVGAGIGLALFALFGLLQGSLIGGAIGLDIVNSIFDPAVQPTLLARVIIGASMLAGVIITGVGFVVICSSVGAVAGYLTGWMAEPRAAATTAYKETDGKVR